MTPTFMEPILLATAFLLILSAAPDARPGASEPAEPTPPPPSLYDFTVKDTAGKDVKLSTYKGDVLLIVNVASK